MIKTYSFLSITLILLQLSACKSPEKSSAANQQAQQNEKVQEPKTQTLYRASRTREFDLLHTALEVSFDWEKQYLYGKANLQLTPYFYPSNKVVLDAKGFDIHKVEIKQNNERKTLDYSYDNAFLTITLDKTYKKYDTLQLYIDYTAKPNELKEGGSSAIRSNKGLYFINPLGENENKPRQIWTQGETEASSCWFPTIDSPNERCTQEIAITVDTNFVSLSNGLLQYSSINGDGTRTDYWKQDKAHAPYLFMMAIGEFAIVKDTWRNKEVNYYVEKKYEDSGKEIFNNTPEMIEFFSQKMGVDYPWEKYHQVIVRDYVSGAMENTSAVIFGEFVQKTKRELIDNNNDDIVAHELFHHWFGDLVTCESWSNLPLNESFATYGSYLWREHQYGHDYAELNRRSSLNGYLGESKRKKVDMIRFVYKDKEDMFDSHSYAKGSLILHMLRKEVGDEAFFKSLQVYLTDNAFNAAEIHHLRLAFEKVTGRDMNPFFNQWFLASGHPVLEISKNYSAEKKELQVQIKQTQNLEKHPLYILPTQIDCYSEGKKITFPIEIRDEINTYTYTFDKAPDYVNIDPGRILLCERKEEMNASEAMVLYKNAQSYFERLEALNFCSANQESECADLIVLALADESFDIRLKSLGSLRNLFPAKEAELENKIALIAFSDSHSKVRSAAIQSFAVNYKNNSKIRDICIVGLADSAYNVVATSIEILADVDPVLCMSRCKLIENENSSLLKSKIATVYANNGTDEQHAFFKVAMAELSGFSKLGFYSDYSKYLLRDLSDIVVIDGLSVLEAEIYSSTNNWLKSYVMESLLKIKKHYSKLAEQEGEQSSKAKKIMAEFDKLADRVAEKEKDEKMKEYLRK